jgi:hypothetical protein
MRRRRATIGRLSKARERKAKTAFIAMPMCPQDPRLEDIHDAIKAGARDAGFSASRIDEQSSNAPIGNRILRAIADCQLVIADLTFGRLNVYYEAGIAEGMGKTPIYLAASDVDIPFDLRDYPVIIYKNMRSLRQLLKERLLRISSEGRS